MEKSKCCVACERRLGDSSWDCININCKCHQSPHQEPVATQEEEIKKEFFEQFTDNFDKDNDYYDSQFTEGRPCRVYDFMMAQIKQAEERGYASGCSNPNYNDGYEFAREEIKLSYELFPEVSAKELLEMGKIITNQ